MTMILIDNCQGLGQAVELLKGCQSVLYKRQVKECFDSTIGGHIRHILDHYDCFLGGLTAEKIDYDTRERDLRIETDLEHAITIITQLQLKLENLSTDLDGEIRVKMDTGSERDTVWASSTPRRELQFLLSHTVHHYALIATMSTLMGISLPEHFGIAPSTLKYRQKMCD